LFDGYLNFKAATFEQIVWDSPVSFDRARVRCVAVTKLLQALHQSRADNSFERELRSWLAPDLLLLDDLALAIPPARSRKDLIRPR